MRPSADPRDVRLPSRGLIVSACVAVLAVLWLSYHATIEWRQAERLLLQRHLEQTADVLLRALHRDMRGADEHVLQPEHWNRIAPEEPYEVSDLVAGAFARYPYPDSFFRWTGQESDPVMFFGRSHELPAWLSQQQVTAAFPVALVAETPASIRPLLTGILSSAREGRQFSAFEATIDNHRYQVVSRLTYRSPKRNAINGVFGFLVDLDRVRESYFPNLLMEVDQLAGEPTSATIAILDDVGALVAGGLPRNGQPIVARHFRLLFFDPQLAGLVHPHSLHQAMWTVQVGMARPPVGLMNSDVTLAVTTAAGLALAIGLLLTARAVRAGVDLARVRSDFVSSVTHELKTPLATIRATAGALVRGQLSNANDISEYAQILDQEAKRLTRLVNNLLAYSKVTDVGEVYSFESVALPDFLDDVLRSFQPQLRHAGFEVQIEVPLELPPLRADRAALALAFDNVIDNAIRYSETERFLGITAIRTGTVARVLVTDRGIGIPRDELPSAMTKFVRGRYARSGGSGLGLAIADRIVRDHGGRLSLASEVGNGTTVSVELPLMP